MDYPYLFQTCGFARIDDIRAELESQREWDFAPSFEITTHIQTRVAERFGFFAPYTPEQIALTKYLKKKRAGKLISTYAWGLYAESCLTRREYA